MGMYPTYWEIPRALLDELLKHPDDAAWVDGLLFDQGGRSHAATWSALPDEELERRFAWPHLTVTAEQRRRLGALDCGKYPNWDSERAFRYFLNAADLPDRIELERLLGVSDEPDALAAAWGEVMAAPAVAHTPYRWAYRVGDTEYGFSTEVPCYGISFYRTPDDLATIWRKVDHIVARYPELAGRIVDRFDSEIRYYYGCATRGSADLDIMW